MMISDASFRANNKNKTNGKRYCANSTYDLHTTDATTSSICCADDTQTCQACPEAGTFNGAQTVAKCTCKNNNGNPCDSCEVDVCAI